MKIRGDIESVNLSTGERWQRVSGDGESTLEQVGAMTIKELARKLITASLQDVNQPIEDAMIPILARREDEIRRKEAQWWDTYIDEHLEKYGKEWRRKRGKERLAKLVSAHES